jgi:CO dehydrogenase/acetyl-CoA synthase delta subunit
VHEGVWELIGRTTVSSSGVHLIGMVAVVAVKVVRV